MLLPLKEEATRASLAMLISFCSDQCPGPDEPVAQCPFGSQICSLCLTASVTAALIRLASHEPFTAALCGELLP